MNEYEERVQRELGPLMPTMGPRRWAELRAAIGRFAAQIVNEANNAAQVILFQEQLRHEAELRAMKDSMETTDAA